MPPATYTAAGRRIARDSSSAGGLDVDIRGIPEVMAMLAKFEHKASNRILQQATNAAGKELKKSVQAAVPNRQYPRHDQYKKGFSANWKRKQPGGQMARLKKSISSRQADRARPATIISARPKVAFYRHWIELGTKPHQIRMPHEAAAGPRMAGVGGGLRFGRNKDRALSDLGSIKHPGVTHTTDYIGIGFARGQAAAMAAMERVISNYVDSI